MSDLEAAIAAEMKEAGCRKGMFSCLIHTWSTRDDVILHWDDARDVCPAIADAVRAGWDAAINAAADRLDALFGSEWGRLKEKEGVVLTEDGRYCDGIAVAEDVVRALSSEGGDRD